jgi:hypothetical protein
MFLSSVYGAGEEERLAVPQDGRQGVDEAAHRGNDGLGRSLAISSFTTVDGAKGAR